MSCGVGHRRGSDPSLLWLWYRPADTAPIPPLAWELPYAMGAALKKAKKKKKKKRKERKKGGKASRKKMAFSKGQKTHVSLLECLSKDYLQVFC